MKESDGDDMTGWICRLLIPMEDFHVLLCFIIINNEDLHWPETRLLFGFLISLSVPH